MTYVGKTENIPSSERGLFKYAAIKKVDVTENADCDFIKTQQA